MLLKTMCKTRLQHGRNPKTVGIFHFFNCVFNTWKKCRFYVRYNQRVAKGAADYTAAGLPMLYSGGDVWMKGVNRRVIELHPQQSDCIESIWVVLRPGAEQTHLAQSRQEAERLAGSLVCWRRRPWLSRWQLAMLGGAAAGLALLLVWML